MLMPKLLMKCFAVTLLIIKIIKILMKKNLFAIESTTGKLAWKKNIGKDKPYDWGFDYYFSSPVINDDTLIIASADGKLLSLDKRNGKEFWQFQSKHFIRATPAPCRWVDIYRRHKWRYVCSGFKNGIAKMGVQYLWFFS